MSAVEDSDGRTGRRTAGVVLALGLAILWFSCEGLSPVLGVRNRWAVDRACATVQVGNALSRDVFEQTVLGQGLERRRLGRVERPEGDVLMLSAPQFLMVTRNCWIELEAGRVKSVRNFTRQP